MYEIVVKSILVELFEIFEAWRGFECTNLNSGGSRKYVMKIIRENEKKKKKTEIVLLMLPVVEDIFFQQW